MGLAIHIIPPLTCSMVRKHFHAIQNEEIRRLMHKKLQVHAEKFGNINWKHSLPAIL